MAHHAETIVFGAGGHCKVLVRTLQCLQHSVVAILDDDARLWGTDLFGVPVVGPISREQDFPEASAIIAIGDNRIRQSLVAQLQRCWLTVIHPHARVDSTARISPGTVVFSGATIQPDARIGAHAIINTNASVDHDCKVGDYAHIAPGTHLAGSVTVGEGVLLGVGCNVIPGAKIGDWATVGAGGTVINDIPDQVVAVGVPAKPT